MINVVCGIRSTGRICTDLAMELESYGHEVKIAYGREYVPEQYQKYAMRIGTNVDVKLHSIKSRLLDGAGFGSKKATKKFIEWIKEYNPDVIHLHNIHGYYINVEVLFNYLKVCGKKIIWTLHDCWAFTGHCANFTMIKCEKWKNKCLNCPQKLSYPKSFIDCSNRNYERKKKLFTQVPNLLIVTPSKWLANLVKYSYLKEYPVNTVNNGIDINIFKPTPSDFRNKLELQNKKIILGVSNVWDIRKGFNDYLKLSKVIDETYFIVLVGVNKKQLKKLPKNMIGITRTNNAKELAEIYTSADVFFNPTYEDNYPTVNLEARACGIPVITYNTGGSPESAGDECIVIEKGDIKGVLSVINMLVKDRKIDINKIDKCVFIEQYIDLYKKEMIYYSTTKNNNY